MVESRNRRALLASLAALTATLTALSVAAPAQANRLIQIEVPTGHVRLAEEPVIWSSRPDTPQAYVLLPDGYDRKRRKGYPVLYLLHGANGDYRTWGEGIGGGIEELADGFEGIVVIPDGGGLGFYTDWHNRGAFERPRWMSYHLGKLRRTVNKRFAIRKGRRWHAIGGVSMGGGGAVRYAAADPGYFGSVIGISSAPLDLMAPESVAVINLTGAAADGTTFEDIFGPIGGPYAVGNDPLALIPNLVNTRVYITSGDGTACPGDEFLPGEAVTELGLRLQADRWTAAAERASVDVTNVHTCGAHTQTEARALGEAMDWGVFGKVPDRIRNWHYRTVARHGRAYELRFRFAEQPAELIRLKRNGRTLTGLGSGEVRIWRGKRCRLHLELPFEAKLPKSC